MKKFRYRLALIVNGRELAWTYCTSGIQLDSRIRERLASGYTIENLHVKIVAA